MAPTEELPAEASNTFKKPAILRMYAEHKPLLVAAKSYNWAEAAILARNLRGQSLVEMLAALRPCMKNAHVDHLLSISFQEATKSWKKLKKTKKGKKEIARAFLKLGKELTKEQIALMLNDQYLAVLSKVPHVMMSSGGKYQRLWGWVLDSCSLGFNAGILSEIQLSAKEQKVKSLKSIFDAISDSTTNFQTTINSKLQSIHNGLKLDDILAVQENCINLTTYLELNLKAIAELAALAYSARKDGFSRRGVSSEEKWGVLSLSVANMTRFASWAYVAAHYLAIITATGKYSTLWKKHQKKANQLDFVSVVPQGKAATLSELMANPEKYRDAFVMVQGFVEQVRLFQEGETKQSSALELTDKTSTQKLSVMLPFKDIAKTGVVAGCFVEICGVFYRSAKDKQWRLRLDTLNYSDYRKESWMDAIAVDVEPWINLWPVGLNLRYSFDALDAPMKPAGLEELSRYKPKQLIRKKAR